MTLPKLPGAATAHLNRDPARGRAGDSSEGRAVNKFYRGLLEVIVTQNCGTCQGKGTIYLCGSEVSCPSCNEEAYRDALLDLGIDPALEDVGAGLGLK